MPFWRTYYHLIWATKNRAELIQPDLEPDLFQYLVNKAAESQVQVRAINGWLDNVHLAATIPPKHSVATVIKRLKGSSTYHMNQTGLSPDAFAWQRGYGVFTLALSQLARAEAYVHHQKEHHRKQTTNAWLERTAEFDEGPEETALHTDAMPVANTRLRDEKVGYRIEDGFP